MTVQAFVEQANTLAEKAEDLTQEELVAQVKAFAEDFQEFYRIASIGLGLTPAIHNEDGEIEVLF